MVAPANQHPLFRRLMFIDTAIFIDYLKGRELAAIAVVRAIGRT